jgi:hypothetical protein
MCPVMEAVLHQLRLKLLKILWRVTRLYSSVVDETLDPLIERSGDFYVFFRQMNNMLYSSLLFWQLQNSDRLE